MVFLGPRAIQWSNVYPLTILLGPWGFNAVLFLPWQYFSMVSHWSNVSPLTIFWGLWGFNVVLFLPWQYFSLISHWSNVSLLAPPFISTPSAFPLNWNTNVLLVGTWGKGGTFRDIYENQKECGRRWEEGNYSSISEELWSFTLCFEVSLSRILSVSDKTSVARLFLCPDLLCFLCVLRPDLMCFLSLIDCL